MIALYSAHVAWHTCDIHANSGHLNGLLFSEQPHCDGMVQYHGKVPLIAEPVN